MTANDIINGNQGGSLGGVRHELADDAEPVRWSNETLLQHVASGIREIYKRRPDAAYVSRIVTECPTPPTALSGTIALREGFALALVYWVCYRAMDRDAEHPENANRAAMYLTKFAGELA